MTLKEVMAELETMGSDSIKKTLLKHGIKEALFGVKVEHLKTIQRKIKTDYNLSNELFFTGNADAMYLAGLIAADEQMTKKDLNAWVKIAVSNNISEYTVPWVAAGSRHGFDLAMEWIKADEEHIAAAGWATLSNVVALKPDSELNLQVLKELLELIEKQIHTAKNRVRYTMNGYIIAVGSYVKDLTKEATATANKTGLVTVDMNGTACNVPDAVTCIKKMTDKGKTGKKKKTVKC